MTFPERSPRSTAPDPEEVTAGLERYMQLTTVAIMLDASVRSVENWIRSGLIEAVRFPELKGQRISRSEYIRFVNTRYGSTQQK